MTTSLPNWRVCNSSIAHLDNHDRQLVIFTPHPITQHVCDALHTNPIVSHSNNWLVDRQLTLFPEAACCAADRAQQKKMTGFDQPVYLGDCDAVEVGDALDVNQHLFQGPVMVHSCPSVARNQSEAAVLPVALVHCAKQLLQ